MARVNISGALWREFRVEALRRQKSVADYLGSLVEREMRRLAKARPGSDNVTPRR